MTGAIRSVDASRPVVSGMHSLEPIGHWTIQDQAEHCDILTTHPDPLWSRHTSQDPLDSLRITLHATAETRMYADIGGKPCFAEEIGTMGPLMGEWAAACRFVRVHLFSLWAHDCRGLQWWWRMRQTEGRRQTVAGGNAQGRPEAGYHQRSGQREISRQLRLQRAGEMGRPLHQFERLQATQSLGAETLGVESGHDRSEGLPRSTKA